MKSKSVVGLWMVLLVKPAKSSRPLDGNYKSQRLLSVRSSNYVNTLNIESCAMRLLL